MRCCGLLGYLSPLGFLSLLSDEGTKVKGSRIKERIALKVRANPI
jgi:hypothetical protein